MTKRSTRWFARAFLFAFTAVIGAALVVPDADAARRMGGGKSFGRQAAPPAAPMQRDAAPAAPHQPAQAAPAQPAPPPAATPAPAGNRWLGPIAGIAAGLGIAALLSHFGLSGAFASFLASMLVIGLLVFAALFVWRMLRGGGNARPIERRMEPAYGGPAMPREQPAPAPATYTPSSAATGAARPGSVAATLGGAGVTQVVENASGPRNIPAYFDAEGFLRNSKVHFYRLQAAWDRRDLNDLSEFTTPEVFAELRTQLTEQAGATQNEVTALDAELLGIEEGPVDWLASVRFHGAMRENGGSAEPFQEIWNLSKRKDGRSGWLLAGIQQVQ
jgi:predicted lipid-binding transport protein (Tim44 family)